MKKNKFICWRSHLSIIIFFMLLQILVITPVLAETSSPGWKNVKAELISPEESRLYYQARLSQGAASSLAVKGRNSIFPYATGQDASFSSSTVTPEIAELARALDYDPKQIFDYVHNNIDYVPYFGLRKGALLTLLDGSGNDFDQASLMVALLRESGYVASFVHGELHALPGYSLANWLGIDNNIHLADVLRDVLGSGGIPAHIWTDISSSSIYGRIERVWVKATIDGIDYVFDPAYKEYTYTPKIDIGDAIGYNRTDLLNAATAGAIVSDDSIQNLNYSNLNSKLSEYTTNLITTLHSQYPNSDVSDIVGGRKIKQEYLTDYSVSLPNTVLNAESWTEIPEAYIATLRIQHEGIDHTFRIPEIAGKRLTMTYTGSNFTPELRLDGVLVATGSSTTQGNKYDMIISVDQPYAAIDGTYCDSTATWKCVSGSTYAIVSNFGGTTDNIILKRQRQLHLSLASGLTDTSEPVLGETLNIMGLTWMKERGLSSYLLAKLSDTLIIRHHKIAVMAQESGYYIDAKIGTVSTISSHNTESEELSHFNAMSIGSAFEHAILEQLMGSDNPGASTIKLMDIANRQDCKIFWANSGNFDSIRPQLRNYSTTTLDKIQNKIDNGSTVILPDNGRLEINQWRGVGYMSKKVNEDGRSLGMTISGDYFGGYGTIQGSVEPEQVNETIQSALPDISYDIETPSIHSSEPVDMATGAYLYDRTDLALGESAPMGLAFSRSYNSSRKWNRRSMGYGWQHNYDIFLKRISDGNPGLGLRTPVDAAAMITNLYIALDLMHNEDNIKGWMMMFLAHKWAVDQLIDNAICVNIGGQVTEYIQLPDGSYNKPPGITTELVDRGDGTFSLQERLGTQMDFDANDRIVQLRDMDGNTLSFTYLGDKLGQVEDAVRRSLTLSYAGDNLVLVEDSEGRNVCYDYDANNDLTGYRDVVGKYWVYRYNSQHQMTGLENSLGITTATNTYDTLGRVNTQIVPRQNGTAKYNFYFSGFRNMEEDPFGRRIIYWLDEKGRTYAVEDELGNKTVKTFDGQNHVIAIEGPRGNTTAFEYDGNQNLTRITDALNYATYNTYDAQSHLTDTIDPLGHVAHFDYDSRHHLTQTTDAEGNTTGFTYYTNGKINTSTDGRGTITTLNYDTNNHPLATKIASHPQVNYTYDAIGRMLSLTDQEGATTRFTYDGRGLLSTKTDPLQRTSSFIYDDAGRLISRTDRNSDTITYTFTPTDELEAINYPDGSRVNFTYNLHDKLISMQDSIGTTTYTYDEIYRLASVTNPYGQTVSYEYDEAGNVIKIIYPDGKAVTYSYDELNRLKTVTDWQYQTATYSYDDVGRLRAMSKFNGTVTNYSYDNANRLISLDNKISDAGFTISSYNYTLDANGNRTQIFQYEPLLPTILNSNTDFSYNLARNRLLTTGLVNFTYDNEGQLASENSISYQFDYEHRLTNINGTNSSQFLYDGKGNRLEANRNGVVTRYIYDAKGNLLAETDSTNTIKKYYIYGLGLLAMAESSGATYSYHYNGVGSAIAMIDQDKNLVNKYSYTPFGLLAAQEESIPQPFTYAGRYGIMTEASSLYYMRARYYDAETCRFISEDPTGFDGGVNLYAYVENNPVSFVDPSGLALVGRRPLDARFPLNGKGVFYHSQIWYVNGSNSGFFNTDEIRSDTGHAIAEYDFSSSIHYDDDLMKQAEQNVQETWDMDWRMPWYNPGDWNNCQDYPDAVIAEYNDLRELSRYSFDLEYNYGGGK